MSTPAQTHAHVSPPGEVPVSEQPIRAQLRQRLLALNYHTFAQCLCLLLTRIGYEDVHIAGRTHWKGRNREGGYDIEAYLPAGVVRRKVIVQVKQFDTLPVYQRSVDELRGTCLRAGAAEALLITTSAFSPIIQKNDVGNVASVAPVRLLNGEDLLDLLLLHRIGVKEGTSETNTGHDGAGDNHCRIGVDTAFFADLSRTYASRRPNRKPAARSRPAWLLSVELKMYDRTRKVRNARKESR